MTFIELIKDAFEKRISGLQITSGEFLLSLLIALGIFIIGIVLGKLVKYGLRKFIDKIRLEKIANAGFINLFLVVIKWSIYLLFINFALIQLNVPALTGWLTTILGVLPTLTGALIIIAVGFGIGNYLKKVLDQTKIENGKILSMIVFYFTNFIFIIFALKTALIPLNDAFIVDILMAIFSLLAGIALLLQYFKMKSLRFYS